MTRAVENPELLDWHAVDSTEPIALGYTLCGLTLAGCPTMDWLDTEGQVRCHECEDSVQDSYGYDADYDYYGNNDAS